MAGAQPLLRLKRALGAMLTVDPTLTLEEAMGFLEIGQNPDLPQSELERSLNVTKQTVTRVVSKLSPRKQVTSRGLKEGLGLVDIGSGNDARTNVLSLTRKGSFLLTRLTEILED